MIENGFGEVIYVDRLLYKHFGVYCGGGRVVHYVKTDGNAFDSVIYNRTRSLSRALLKDGCHYD